MTRTNVVEFGPALQRRQASQNNRLAPASFGPLDRNYPAGIDGLLIARRAAGAVVPFRKH